MTTKLKLGVCLLGLSLLTAQHAVAEDKTKSLQPVPYTPSIKDIRVVGDKAYLLDSQGKHSALGDGTYNTDNGMIIIVGGKVQSPRDPASGQATGKRQHKPVNLSNEIDKRGLNPQPLPPKSMNAAVTKITAPRDPASGLPTGKRQHKPLGMTDDINNRGLNPQPLPPQLPTSTLNPAEAKLLNPQPLPPGENDNMENLQLQMQVERRSKSSEAASNIIKKSNDTKQAVIQNLK